MDFPIGVMCKLMKSRSSYYEWLSNPECNLAKEDAEFTKMIRVIFTEGHGTYGSRRIKKRLIQQAIVISRRRIIRLMNEELV